MEPYAGVDYNLTLCQLLSRVGSNTFTVGIEQPYARVDFISLSGT